MIKTRNAILGLFLHAILLSHTIVINNLALYSALYFAVLERPPLCLPFERVASLKPTEDLEQLNPCYDTRSSSNIGDLNAKALEGLAHRVEYRRGVARVGDR
jgi:hypothetical protein